MRDREEMRGVGRERGNSEASEVRGREGSGRRRASVRFEFGLRVLRFEGSHPHSLPYRPTLLSMSAIKKLSPAIKELRFLMCQNGQASAGAR